MTTSKPHILVFPFPAQGHLLPLLRLSHQLALRSISLTIIITPQNLSSLSPLLSAHPQTIQTLNLPLPTADTSLPPGVENVSQIGNQGGPALIAALMSLSDAIAAWFSSQPVPPVAIISDLFLGWTETLAANLGIPRIAFWSSGPFFCSIADRLWRFHNSPESRLKDVFSFPDIPNYPSFPRHHLPSSFLRYKESDPNSGIVRDSILANRSSWASIFNTFEAIEGEYLDLLRTEMYSQGRIYSVGPISLFPGPGSGNTPDDFSEVMRWLDGYPDDAVLYVCFGSQKLLSRAQTEALASALESVHCPFIWAVKSGTPEQLANGYGWVPDRVMDTGRVISGWAPQVEILGHRAVGFFLSHCGWNSVLEAAAVGVEVLAWPMEAEQFLNARLLAGDMHAATVVCEGATTVPVVGELGKKITAAMRGEATEERRERVKKIKEEAATAVREKGSSVRDLDALVAELWRLKAT